MYKCVYIHRHALQLIIRSMHKYNAYNHITLNGVELTLNMCILFGEGYKIRREIYVKYSIEYAEWKVKNYYDYIIEGAIPQLDCWY